MEVTVALVVVLFVFALLWIANRAYQQVKTPHDYLSFGEDVDELTLQRAFEGTNASFATATVSLFLYAFMLGSYAFAMPLGFAIGVLFYSYWILPKKMHLLAEGIRYPALLERSTGSSGIRLLVVVAVIFSLWLFTLVEVQALNHFLGGLFRSFLLSDYLMVLLIVSVVALYAIRGGYRTIILTDRVQILVVYLGTAALVLGNLYLMSQIGLGEVVHALSTFGGGLQLSTLEGSVFIVETVVGLLFSQLIYYDNWQRLSFYVSKQVEYNREQDQLDQTVLLDGLCAKIQRRYRSGALVLLVIYIIPILMGYLYIAQGEVEGGMALLVRNVESIWSEVPVIGPLLVVLIALQFVSSLMSTTDTYIIGATNTIYEDLLRKPFRFEDKAQSDQALSLLHWIAGVFSVSILLILWVDPDVEVLFLFLFYSVNVLAGPIYYSIVRERISGKAVIVSLLFGVGYLLLPLIVQGEAGITPLSGIVPLLASLLIVKYWKVA